MEKRAYDLIILGGGPAGMSAAIYASRANIRTILLEKNITGGLVNSTYTVANFPSYSEIHGMELMEKMREHVDSLGVPVEETLEINSLELEGPIKRVSDGETLYEAPAIILATGRQPIDLQTPTTAEQVHFCAICDGEGYKGKSVLVVGGGNSAFDESLYLLGLGVHKLVIVEMMDRYFAASATQDALFAHHEVSGQCNTRVQDLVVEGNRLVGAVLENTSTGTVTKIPTDGVFVFLGQEPNNALFKDCINLDESGYIITDETMGTNISGVFAAGDITRKRYRQITTAVSDGTIAALSVENWLRSYK